MKAALVGFFLILAVFAAALELPGLAAYAQYLDDVVLNADYGPAARVVTRWPAGTVTWTIAGPDKALWTALVADAMADLDKFTPDVKLVYTDAQDAMLQIWCGPRSTWKYARFINGGLVCGYALVWSGAGTISRAAVLLADPGPSRQRIVREETFQVFGFLGDAAAPGSITSQTTWDPDLTTLDVLWCLVIYSRLAPGATRDEALAALRVELARLSK